jgi:hypothetical protein
MVDRCALSCGMLAMRRGMLRRFRVVCLLFLFFFFAARGTRERNATNQDNNCSRASDSASFAPYTAMTKWYKRQSRARIAHIHF